MSNSEKKAKKETQKVDKCAQIMQELKRIDPTPKPIPPPPENYSDSEYESEDEERPRKIRRKEINLERIKEFRTVQRKREAIRKEDMLKPSKKNNYYFKRKQLELQRMMFQLYSVDFVPKIESEPNEKFLEFYRIFNDMKYGKYQELHQNYIKQEDEKLKAQAARLELN